MDPLAHSGLVIVDKPSGLTSHDVVSRLRRAFRTRKVGHAGTLDPAATGVLVVGIERGTRFLTHLVATAKAYDATVRLGQATSTDDAEGEVLHRSNPARLDALTSADIEAGIAELSGPIMQRPSAVSAIKIKGRRAHELVRAGEAVELPARPITVHGWQVHGIRRPNPGAIEVDVSVECSSGTYIRALARDLGETLGVGGHLTRLRRTRVGVFGLRDARPLAALHDAPSLTYSLDQALQLCYPTVGVTEEEAVTLSHGGRLSTGNREIEAEQPVAAVAPDGRAIALVVENEGALRPIFVARPAGLG